MARARRQSMCRYCYTYGHTKRTCPKVKEYVKENPNSYLAHEQKRKCSYCRQEGHTKIKCPDWLEKKRQHNIQILENRSNICLALSDLGVAPGALIKAEFYTPDKDGIRRWIKSAGIVTNIRWDSTTKIYDDLIEVINPVTNLVSTARCPKHHLLKDTYSEIEVLSPVSQASAKEYNERLMNKTNETVIKRHGY